MPIYNAILTAVDAKETRRYAGLREAKNFAEERISVACEEAMLLAEPCGTWQEYDYEPRAQIIASGDEKIPLVGKSIGRHLEGCEKIVVMAVTVVERIENEITAKFAADEYTAAVLLDAAATTAVEQIADELEKAVYQVSATRGFAMRHRFSPGYGDWSLTEQKNIVRLSRATEIGIRLSDSFMLMPRKSVTAVIGLFRKTTDETQEVQSGCATCKKNDCVMRKK